MSFNEKSLDIVSTKESANERVIGLDILRILACFGITMIHFQGYTSLLGVVNEFSINGLLVYVFNALSRTSVNIFVIISGYFLVRSKFKWERVFLVAGETLCYSLLLFLIGIAFSLEKMSLSIVIKSFLPIISRHYWFATAYVVLYLVSPFVNKLVMSLSKREYTTLILGAALLFSAWTTLLWFTEGALTAGKTGILWLIYMYLIGGYFRIYPPKLRTRTLLFSAVALLVFLVAYQYLKGRLGLLSNFAFLEEDSLFSLLLSAILFLLFLRIKFETPWLNKLITSIGGASFGVYLIQEHGMVRSWLWLKVVKSDTIANDWYLFLVYIFVVIVLLAIAFVVSKCYRILFILIKRRVIRKG